MVWLKTSQGAVNLDRVVNAVAEGGDTGNVFLFIDQTNYVTADLDTSTTAEAAARIQQLVRATDLDDI